MSHKLSTSAQAQKPEPTLKEQLLDAVQARQDLLDLEMRARASITAWDGVPLGEALRTGLMAKREAQLQLLQDYESDLEKIERKILDLAVRFALEV